jgi:hypothetical protein
MFVNDPINCIPNVSEIFLTCSADIIVGFFGIVAGKFGSVPVVQTPANRKSNHNPTSSILFMASLQIDIKTELVT